MATIRSLNGHDKSTIQPSAGSLLVSIRVMTTIEVYFSSPSVVGSSGSRIVAV